MEKSKMKPVFPLKLVKAFTLQELLIVLVIISILILLALPNLMPLITKAKSMEAKLQLEHLYNMQRNYFMEHSKYASELNEISFDHLPLVTEVENGTANYRIFIDEASESHFVASATSVVDFDGDGLFNTWSINEQKKLIEVIKD